jgi:hypothetical protein
MAQGPNLAPMRESGDPRVSQSETLGAGRRALPWILSFRGNDRVVYFHRNRP